MSKKNKKQQAMTKIELYDAFVPIFCVTWVLAFGYIALFNESALLTHIAITPIFFAYALYLVFSAVYTYKELELLKAWGKDTYEVEKRHRKKAPKLEKGKLIAAACVFVAGVLLCIFI